MKSKSIAILGNMNNNGFSLMRYFVKLKFDAHLFLYSNDGVGSLSHFKPTSDVFDIGEWDNRIHQTNINNSYYQAFKPGLFRKIVQLTSNTINSLLRRSNILNLCEQNQIKSLFSGYDYIITSGYGLSILYNNGIKVNIFSPYSIGIEGIGRYGYAPPIYNFLKRILFEYGRFHQIRALKHVSFIVAGDSGLTSKNAIRLGFREKLINYHMPLVFLETNIPQFTNDNVIDRIGKELDNCEFSIMMHCQLIWHETTLKNSHVASKNNHWLLLAFKELIVKYPKLDCKLIIVEYGQDVKRTRDLALHLNIHDYVVWVPKTTRKNLMWLLQKVTVGCGEFLEIPRTTWGGTGYEVLASGKPLMQGFLFDQGEYEAIFGHPEPPLLKVKSQKDVSAHLLELVHNRIRTEEIGIASREWFNTYNGINLAKKWLEVLEKSDASRQQY
jgi:hypothetical protein